MGRQKTTAGPLTQFSEVATPGRWGWQISNDNCTFSEKLLTAWVIPTLSLLDTDNVSSAVEYVSYDTQPKRFRVPSSPTIVTIVSWAIRPGRDFPAKRGRAHGVT